MSKLKGKIDFVLLISATNANPNGDPLNGNRPRENFDGYGEISDVCIKRKIRNRLQDMGQKIFVQSDDRADDGYGSLRERAEGCESLKTEMKQGKKANKERCAQIACQEWMDVRSFGQVFAFKGADVSRGIRGPVSIHQAVRQGHGFPLRHPWPCLNPSGSEPVPCGYNQYADYKKREQ